MGKSESEKLAWRVFEMLAENPHDHGRVEDEDTIDLDLVEEPTLIKRRPSGDYGWKHAARVQVVDMEGTAYHIFVVEAD